MGFGGCLLILLLYFVVIGFILAICQFWLAFRIWAVLIAIAATTVVIAWIADQVGKRRK